ALVTVVRGDDRIDSPARTVLDVVAGARFEVAAAGGTGAPARRGRPREARPGGLGDGRQQPRRGARGLGARRPALEERDPAAGPGQLVGGGAADDAAADDQDLHAPRSSASRKRRVAPAGDSAAMIGEMTAMPRAPARRRPVPGSGVRRRIASRGRRTVPATRVSRSSPWGGPYGRLDGVS